MLSSPARVNLRASATSSCRVIARFVDLCVPGVPAVFWISVADRTAEDAEDCFNTPQPPIASRGGGSASLQPFDLSCHSLCVTVVKMFREEFYQR